MAQPDYGFGVVVGSPFSDMVAEPDTMQEHFSRRQCEFCRKREARFQALDPRCDVTKEQADDSPNVKESTNAH